MTQQHIFYIPIIFMLGFVIGLIYAEAKSTSANYRGVSDQRNARKRVMYTFFFFALIFTITHVIDLPYNSKNVSRLLGHQEIFDKSPLFTSEEVYEKISTFKSEGIKAYKRLTYTSDLLFPLSFLVFLLALQQYMQYRLGNAQLKTFIINSIPYMWFSFDLLENLMIFLILNYYPIKYDMLASLLGVVTLLKFTFLFSALVVPIISYIYSKFRTING